MAYGIPRFPPTTPVPAASTVGSVHDPNYRRLFAFPRMVADLLRAVAQGDWIGDVDLDTLEKLPAEHVGDSGQQRRGDAVWRVRFRTGWLYLLVLLEFQSGNDPRMALRNLEYTALLYRELDRRRELGMPGRWPPVLPLVLYNGDAPWTAALEMGELIAAPAALLPCQPSQRSLLLDERHARVDDLPLGNLMRAVVAFEQSRTAGDLAQAAAAAAEWLRSPGDAELNRAFASWLGQMVARMKPEHAEVELGGTLEEAAMTLVERVAQWPEQWRQEGVAQGRREGVAQGRREGVVQGRREGVAQGRREGVVEERALLRRLAAVRFGEAIARQVADLLENTDDWDQLAAVAELIVRARRGPQLLEDIARRLRQPDKGLAP